MGLSGRRRAKSSKRSLRKRVLSDADLVKEVCFADRTTNGHHYRPLDPDKQEIRLLYPVSSPRPNEPLHYRTEHVSLSGESIPVFNAVSYTRGQLRAAIASMYLDGKLSYVPPSAESALRGIAMLADQHISSEQDTPIWTDAICIDHFDSGEKSAQLALMTEIYSKTATVVIWLGDSDLNADDAFHAVENFHRFVGEWTANFIHLDSLSGVYQISQALCPGRLDVLICQYWVGRLKRGMR